MYIFIIKYHTQSSKFILMATPMEHTRRIHFLKTSMCNFDGELQHNCSAVEPNTLCSMQVES
jgi:hypothetical protein